MIELGFRPGRNRNHKAIFMKDIFRLRYPWILKQRGYLPALFLAALFMTSLGLFPAGASEQDPGIQNIRKGVFLVAAPQLSDPNFHRTVVLLIAYEKAGAVGLIINRPTDTPIIKALPDLHRVETLSNSLYFGGPVGQNSLVVLLRSKKLPNEGHKVFNDIYVTQSRDTLAEVLEDPNPERNIRIYAGYAGWGPGQLDRETSHGDWVIIDADPESIFSEKPSEIWTELHKRSKKIEVDNKQISLETAMSW